jgi:hypothetical protein
MAVQYSTLRPGLLVSLKDQRARQRLVCKRTIEADHVTPTGAKLEVWETERRVAAPEEHERACKARNAAGSVIRSVCSTTAFGLLCPEDKAAQLEEAIGRAREIAAEFNATATVSQLGVYVITGRVAQDDVEAVRAIKSEVRELMESMQNGIKTLDVKAVRAAAIKARSIGQMLSDDASDKIKVAIDLARKSANAIAKVGEGVRRRSTWKRSRRSSSSASHFWTLPATTTTASLPCPRPLRLVRLTSGRTVSRKATRKRSMRHGSAARWPTNRRPTRKPY